MLTIPDEDTAKKIVITAFNRYAPDYFLAAEPNKEPPKYDANLLVQKAGDDALKVCAGIVFDHFQQSLGAHRELAAHMTGVAKGVVDIPHADMDSVQTMRDFFGEALVQMKADQKELVAACQVLNIETNIPKFDH